MPKPLVSILTPTFNRHALLMEAIENVRSQTYRPLEHVIVSDGPDEDLYDLVTENIRTAWLSNREHYVPIHFFETGHHWTSMLTESYAAAPMMVAQLLARGTYQSWLADDERMAPEYIETMVSVLEKTGKDFAYPRVCYYRWQMPDLALGIGCDPPRMGALTTIVYRASMLEKTKGPYRTHTGRANDWDFISRAMEGGASWVFVDKQLFSHRDDRDCPTELYTEPLPEFAR